jgi:hypothetical protein
MMSKHFVCGLFHFIFGALLFRRGPKGLRRAERHFVLARYYLNRSEGEWRGSLKRTGMGLRGKILEGNDRRLRIIGRQEAERMEKRRKEYERIPGLFESEWRELNLPLCLTCPGKTPYDGG